MKYSQSTLNALEKVRRANPNVSQRRLARNIYMLTSPDQGVGEGYPVVTATNDLYRQLGHPTEIALQHLIRRIDREAVNVAVTARVVAGRNRKTVGVGRRIPV